MRFFLLILLISTPGFAQNKPDLKSQPRVRVITEPVKSERPGLPKPTDTGGGGSRATVHWGGSVEYLVRTDLADEEEPRIFSHELNLGAGFEHHPTRISVGAGLRLIYESLGERHQEVLVDEGRQDAFISDVGVTVDKRFSLGLPTLSLGLSNDFPTSAEAQREAYNSITGLELGLLVPIFKNRLNLSARSFFYYIWNSYEYSPTTGNLNKDGGWRGTLGLNLTLLPGLVLGGSVGTQTSRYLDGTTDQTYRNSISLNYTYDPVTVGFTLSNGTYIDQSEASIWFVDEFRKTASFRVILSL